MLVMADLVQLLLRKMGLCLGKKPLLMEKELDNIVTLTMMVKPLLSDIQLAKMDSESLKVLMFQKEPMD